MGATPESPVTLLAKTKAEIEPKFLSIVYAPVNKIEIERIYHEAWLLLDVQKTSQDSVHKTELLSTVITQLKVIGIFDT